MSIIRRTWSGGSGCWKFDGVQFLAHVGHDEALVNAVDFLAGVVDQFHHFGLRHALSGPARDERDAGAMEGQVRQVQLVVLLEKPPPHF